MTVWVILVVVIQLFFLEIVSFINIQHFFRYKKLYSSKYRYRLNAVSLDTEWDGENYDQLPVIPEALIQQVDRLLDNLLSSSTMKTVTYYMLEFKNDIEYQWIMKFENCYEDGFIKQQFDDYIAKMIKIDKHEVQIIMDAPKMYMKNIDPKRRSNARLQYSHMIEPRKGN